MKLLIGFLSIGAMFFLLVLLSMEGESATIVVAQDGSGDHDTIQAAIDNATAGDTIRVHAGVYNESVTVNKSVDLFGNGSETIVIEADRSISPGSDQVMKITADGVTLAGFMLTVGEGSAFDGLVIQSNASSIHDNEFSGGDTTVAIKNSVGIVVFNNTINNYLASGVLVSDSHDCILVNNSLEVQNWDDFEPSVEGIYLRSSWNITLNHNTVINGTAGIRIRDSHNNHIKANTISNSSMYGLDIMLSHGNIIAENHFDRRGICMWSSQSNTLQGNAMAFDGVSILGPLEDWTSHSIDTTNTVNGKPVRYYKNIVDGTVPSNTGQVIIANCSQIAVEDLTLQGNIIVAYSSNVTIINNNLTNNWSYKIIVRTSSHIWISNNVITSSGIMLSSSSYNVIDNNTAFQGAHGLYLDRGGNNIIKDNVFSHHYFEGIRLSSTHGNQIVKNICNWNERRGIYLTHSNDNTLINNTLLHNPITIDLKESYNNTIIGIEPMIEPVHGEDDKLVAWTALSVLFILLLFSTFSYLGGHYRELRNDEQNQQECASWEVRRRRRYERTLQDHDRWRPGG